jgi:hypothetical protein
VKKFEIAQLNAPPQINVPLTGSSPGSKRLSTNL